MRNIKISRITKLEINVQITQTICKLTQWAAKYSKKLAKDSLSQRLLHQKQVTRLPNHLCPSSWAIIVAMKILLFKLVLASSYNKYASLKKTSVNILQNNSELWFHLKWRNLNWLPKIAIKLYYKFVLSNIPVVYHSPVFHGTGREVRKSNMVVLHYVFASHLMVLDAKVIVQFVGDLKTDFSSILVLVSHPLAGDDLERFGSSAGCCSSDKVTYVESDQVSRNKWSRQESFTNTGTDSVNNKINFKNVTISSKTLVK